MFPLLTVPISFHLFHSFLCLFLPWNSTNSTSPFLSLSHGSTIFSGWIFLFAMFYCLSSYSFFFKMFLRLKTVWFYYPTFCAYSHFRTGVSNSNPLRGHIFMGKVYAGHNLEWKGLCGPQLNFFLYLIHNLTLFEHFPTFNDRNFYFVCLKDRRGPH